jgi:outer membrane immunogenic protein
MKRQFYSFLTAILLIGAISTPGHANDDGDHGGCVKGPFSGFYVGAHAGWIKADSDQLALNNGVSLSDEEDGFTIGVHSGYNLQCGRLLIGFESETNWADIETSSSIAGQTVSVEYDYWGALRVRGGIVHNNNLLLYATGGLAYARLDRQLDAPAFGIDDSDSELEWGWTAGGGAELLCGRWSFRAEALYIDVGDETITYTANAPCVVCESKIRYEDDFVVARVGVSLKLHHDEPVAPLK